MRSFFRGVLARLAARKLAGASPQQALDAAASRDVLFERLHPPAFNHDEVQSAMDELRSLGRRDIIVRLDQIGIELSVALCQTNLSILCESAAHVLIAWDREEDEAISRELVRRVSSERPNLALLLNAPSREVVRFGKIWPSRPAASLSRDAS